jgi:aryl-alcohol dehydrogenase-like predicted oxidoreductase
METKRLGRTGLQVSRLCLGTMNFGPNTPEPEAFRIMDRALAEGVQFFDTANVYGRSAGRGATERIVGNWFAQSKGRRQQVVLATKVYGRMGDGVNEARLSARHIKLACEESLSRLQTDFIDLYQMHHIDRDTPWDEVWQAMELLVQQGKVLYVGSSNFAGWHIARAMETARQRNFLGLVSEQSLYHLNARTVELEVIPACREYGLGLLPWSPLGGGLLGGILGKQQTGRRADSFAQERLAKARPRIEAYESLCKELALPPGELALAWLLHNPIVTAPIIGPRTLEQLESALKALEIKLSAEVLKKLDAIFPPTGEAPESYAW